MNSRGSLVIEKELLHMDVLCTKDTNRSYGIWAHMDSTRLFAVRKFNNITVTSLWGTGSASH